MLNIGVLSTTQKGSEMKKKARCDIAAEVIDIDIPLLASRSSMEALRCSLNFCTNRLELQQGWYIQLHLNGQGHLTTQLEKSSAKGGSEIGIILTADSSGNQAPDGRSLVSTDEIRRLHLHLAHASVSVMRRLSKQAERQVEEKELKDVVGKCGRSEALQRVERPLISQRIPLYPGRTVCIDCFRLPGIVGCLAATYLMMVCALSKLVAVVRLPNLLPKHGDQEIDFELDLRLWPYGETGDGPRPRTCRQRVGFTH